jgi:hypothetical protein
LTNKNATTREARAWARKHYNFMTPRLISMQSVGRSIPYWVEIAEGEDFDHKPMFGVGIIEWDYVKQEFNAGMHQYVELKKLVRTYEEAKQLSFEIMAKVAIAETEAARKKEIEQ